VGIVLLWGVRDYEHRRAVNALEARTYQDVEPLRVSAYPKMIDPFHWSGVVETPAFFALAPVDSLTPEVDPEGRLDIRSKPEETEITLAAKRSYLGRIYLDWAQYPVTETEPLPPPQEGYIVHFIDLRYEDVRSSLSGNRSRRALTAGVELDKNLNVIGDVFGTGKNQTLQPDPSQR
jgi:inner membrane protein